MTFFASEPGSLGESETTGSAAACEVGGAACKLEATGGAIIPPGWDILPLGAVETEVEFRFLPGGGRGPDGGFGA